MKIHKRRTVSSAVLFAVLAGLVACGSPTEDTTADIQEVEETTTSSADKRSAVRVGGKLFSVPSPAQMALMLKKLGLKYDRSLMADANSSESATSKQKKALAMGVHGADLTYATSFSDAQSALSLFRSVEGLADELELSNAFDKELLERFKSNLGSQDSLLALSGSAFRAADRYLKENDRNEVASLVLAGGWVESLHLATRMQTDANDQSLADRIGEQRSALNNLIGLLKQNDQQGEMQALTNALVELSGEFNNISTDYKFEEPVTDVKNKTTHINSTSKVNISNEQLQAISTKVGAIRSMILS